MGKKFFLQCFGIFFMLSVTAYSADIKGSSDHPMIGRFDGAEIVAYQKRNFDEMTFLVSELARGQETKTLDVEGKVTRIMYATSAENSIASIFRNYKKSITSNGFEIIFTCKSPQCGFDFPNKFMVNRAGLYDFSFGNAREDHRYMVARKTDKKGGNLYAAIMVYNNSSYTHDIRTQVEVVQEEALDDSQIVVKTASDIDIAIKQTGHISLYGIYFDSDKAVVKPDSKPTIDEIAKLLKASPELRLFIVGHTDNQGSVQHNMDLSNKRANAVKGELVNRHGIDIGRLGTVGLGFFAPVSSNNTNNGRSANRRVELVEWNE